MRATNIPKLEILPTASSEDLDFIIRAFENNHLRKVKELINDFYRGAVTKYRSKNQYLPYVNEQAVGTQYGNILFLQKQQNIWKFIRNWQCLFTGNGDFTENLKQDLNTRRSNKVFSVISVNLLMNIFQSHLNQIINLFG